MVNQRGAFVVVEGGEGAGKTSVLSYLREQFPDALFTREPGGSAYAEEIRNVALISPHARNVDGLTQLLLMFAARRDHLRQLIAPARAEGKLVICDRFAASSWAYNICGQEQRELAELFGTLENNVVGDMSPDLYVYLDVPVKVGIARRMGDTEGEPNHFDERKFSFHERVHAGYKEYLADKPHTIVDATKSLSEVCEEVKEVISGLSDSLSGGAALPPRQ